MLAVFVVIFMGAIFSGIVACFFTAKTNAEDKESYKNIQNKNKNRTSPKDPLEANLLKAANTHLKKKHR